MSLFEDELSELAEAVFRGDLVRAEGALDAMHSAGCHSETIRKAKYRARPGLRQLSRLAEPEVFPLPGHGPGTFGLPSDMARRAASKTRGKRAA